MVTIPRAGGDYVWQSRILGSGIGFVLAATGWWFILWLWAPIYGNILSVQLFQPLWATLKWTWPAGGAAWFGTNNGIFVVTLITIALAGVLVSLGMAGYAKVQRWCFLGGLVGFAVVVVLLLVNIARQLRELVQPRRRTSSSACTTPTRRPTPAAAKAGLHLAAVRVRPARADACCWCRP